MIFKAKNLLVVLLSIGASVYASDNRIAQINKAAILSRESQTGNFELFHKDGTFLVKQNNKLHAVENYNLDKPLRNIETAQLAKLLNGGHLQVTKADDQFVLRHNAHLNGGGPIFGVITAITGGIATGAAATAAFVVALPAGPVAAAGAGYVTAKVGVVATAYATAAATASPTP